MVRDPIVKVAEEVCPIITTVPSGRIARSVMSSIDAHTCPLVPIRRAEVKEPACDISSIAMSLAASFGAVRVKLQKVGVKYE